MYYDPIHPSDISYFDVPASIRAELREEVRISWSDRRLSENEIRGQVIDLYLEREGEYLEKNQEQMGAFPIEDIDLSILGDHPF